MVIEFLSWFKKDSTASGSIPEEPLLEIKPTPPLMITKEVTPKPRISEPVIAFVREYVKKGSRLKLKAVRNHYRDRRYTGLEYFNLADRVSKDSWSVCVHYRIDSDGYGSDVIHKIDILSDNLNFLTLAEDEYLCSCIREYSLHRVARLRELKNIRKVRTSLKERDRLKEVYCNGN